MFCMLFIFTFYANKIWISNLEAYTISWIFSNMAWKFYTRLWKRCGLLKKNEQFYPQSWTTLQSNNPLLCIVCRHCALISIPQSQGKGCILFYSPSNILGSKHFVSMYYVVQCTRTDALLSNNILLRNIKQVAF